MANGWKLWRDCSKCHGDGLVADVGMGLDSLDEGTPGELNGLPSITCPECKGAKRFVWGWLEEELTVMP